MMKIMLTAHAEGGGGGTRTRTGPVTMSPAAQRRYDAAMARGDVEGARRISDRSFAAGMRARVRRANSGTNR